MEGIKISKDTLRKWLIETGDWERWQRTSAMKTHNGADQIDGSHHTGLKARAKMRAYGLHR